MRARDQRWNYLGHILSVEEHRVTRHVPLQCIKQGTDLLFGEVLDSDVYNAMHCAISRVDCNAK